MRITSAGRAARRITGAALAGAMIPALLFGGSSSATPTFDAPTKFGARGFELGINVMSDGTIFVDEPAGLGAHSNLWRSDNDGANFTKLTFTSPWNRLPGGGDSDVAVTEDGRVYFLDLWGGSNSIAVSEDKGATWAIGTPFTTLPLTDRQWIAVGERDPGTGKDTVYVIYQQLNPPNWVMFSRSRDGGVTWDFHRPTPFATGGVSGATGKLVSDGDYLAFTYDQGARQYIAFSTDAGANWTSQVISEFQDSDNNINGTALAGQYLYTSWIDRQHDAVRFSVSSDRGMAWSSPVELSTSGSMVYTWVAARGSKVAVVWYESDSPGAPDDVTGTWRVMYTESLDFGANWSTPVSLSGTVKVGPICTQGLACNSGREVGDFLTIQITPDNESIIAYYDGRKDGNDPSGSAGVVTRQSL